jgi:hypothetical protein
MQLVLYVDNRGMDGNGCAGGVGECIGSVNNVRCG